MPCVAVGKTEECNDGFSPQSADVQIGYGEYQSRTEIVVIPFWHAGVCSGPAQEMQCEFQISARHCSQISIVSALHVMEYSSVFLYSCY